MNRRAGWLLAACVLTLLGSCSATKLAYNRLDWLVAWEIGKYVELEGESKVLFDAGFSSLWRWHRSTQLAAYARDLRDIARVAEGPVTIGQISGYQQQAREYGLRLYEEAVPHTAKVLAALDDEQVDGLLQRMAAERRERAEEDAGRTPAEAREESGRYMTRSLRRWVGRLDDTQKALVTNWAGARRHDPALWQRYGDQWAAEFERTLAARTQPGFEDRVRRLFWEPDLPDAAAMRAFRTQNRETFAAFLARLAPTLSEQQRRHLRDTLNKFAGDLEELARQAGAGAKSIG